MGRAHFAGLHGRRHGDPDYLCVNESDLRGHPNPKYDASARVLAEAMQHYLG